MTAPDTNLKKQKRRHRGPLVGMTVAVAVAVALLMWLLFRTLTGTPETTEQPRAPAESTEAVPAESDAAAPTMPDSSTPQVIEETPPPTD